MEARSSSIRDGRLKKLHSLVQGAISPATSSESTARVVKKSGGFLTGKATRSRSSSEKKEEENAPPNSNRIKSTLMMPTMSSSAASLPRRNSTGGRSEKLFVTGSKSVLNAGKNVSPLVQDVEKKSRRLSLPPASSKSLTPMGKSASPSLLSGSKTCSVKADSMQRSAITPLDPLSSRRSARSLSLDSSNGSNRLRKTISNASSPGLSTRSLKSESLSTSVERVSSLLGRKISPTTVSDGDFRFLMLPQADAKVKDDLRLDLRGHKLRSLDAIGLNLSPRLEFVYLRDNLLSSVMRIEMFKQVKVLDLSFNDFKGPGFEPLGNCKHLQQLYLAGNQISSLSSLPELPSLEFLSVAQNKLKSLSMANQPRLQVLAASKNKVSTLKGFPFLPVLEHLRIEDNPILLIPHVEAASILLIGPTLKKFNDRDLSSKELELSMSYPAHTPICIRDGWQFEPPTLAIKSTLSFLFQRWKDNSPPGFMVKEFFVDQPFEEDICCCHFSFTNLNSGSDLILKYQWFVGERTLINFEAIAHAVQEVYWPKHEDVGKILKVECTPILKEMEYPPIFAISEPVSPGTKQPKVLNLSVHGELIEGNVIRGSAEISWCGGTPGKCVASWLRRRWNSSPVVIVGAEEEEYKLIIEDIGSSLVFMYTPVTEEGSKGEPQYAMTDFVKAAPPSVSNVQILGDAIEGNTVRGTGKYFGGTEGPSKFEWRREDDGTGIVSSGTSEYILTKEDIGFCLTFIYIPVNFEGQEGESVSTMSAIVRKAPPKVHNLKIMGDLREGSKLTATATVIRGIEGSCRVQWFKTSSSKLVDESRFEAISSSKITKTFRVPLGAVGSYIALKFIPVAADGHTGEPGFVISEKIIETLLPSINFISINGDCCEGEMLTASYGYIGGHEGSSLYNWYLHDEEGTSGILIPAASGSLQYRITKDAISKLISFICTPFRDDGINGEPKTCWASEKIGPGSPRLLSLKIVGEGVEGATLHAEKNYWGGEEGSSNFCWFLTSLDGVVTEIEGAKAAFYKISFSDIGFLISVSCEPIRSDWIHGPTATSEHIGPIIPGLPNCSSLEFLGSLIEGRSISFVSIYSGGEMGCCLNEWFRLKENGIKEKVTGNEFLDLTFEDVGRCIELVYTPVRKDGLIGAKKSFISTAVAPAEPKGIELVLPDCLEDGEIVPIKAYFGGKEGHGEYIWCKSRNKPDESIILNVSNASGDLLVVGNSMTYKPTLEDVGFYLTLIWVPTRDDGKQGSPLMAVSSIPVIAALPVVSIVYVKHIGSDIYEGGGRYHGGFEGPSMYSWYRQTCDGTIALIPGITSTTYKANDPDYKCRLLFGYTPVRSDFIVGELVLSEPSPIVLPEVPKIEMLSINGNEVEGDVLTAVEMIPNTENQKHVWRRYKKDVKYQWFYSEEHPQLFERIPSQHSASYRLRFEDISRFLKCECTVFDVFGRSGETVSATTSAIVPGMPKVSNLEIEGRGFHTNLYAVRGVYSGGMEGKSKIQWLRSMVGSPDLISLPGEVGRMYEANVDDVGYRLVALYTPVREDGLEGDPTSVSTEPITVEPDVHREVKHKLELGSIKFEVLIEKDKVPGTGSLEKRILEVSRKRIKVVKPGSKTSFPVTDIRGTYAPPFHLALRRNDQHRFKIVVDGGVEVDLVVQTRHMRDVIVLVVRGLAQRFNSTSLNSLLKAHN